MGDTVQPQAAILVHISGSFTTTVLAFHLEASQKVVPPPVFTTLWQRVASLLSSLLVEELILENSFSRGGAKQLETDITRGLLPIFGAFTSRPRAHFPILLDCIKLMVAQAGTLMLTLEAMEKSPGIGSSNTLADLGVTKLTEEQAGHIIRTRVDLDIL